MKLKICIVGFIVGVYLTMVSQFNSTICIFKNITGLPCPGCGLTRAYLAFFRGDIIKAIEYHPLFLIPLIVLIMLIYNKLKVKRFFVNKNLEIFFIVIIMGVYAVRLMFLFPDYKPMDINYNGIIPRLLRIVEIIS